MKVILLAPALCAVMCFLFVVDAADPQRHPLLSNEDIEHARFDRMRGRAMGSTLSDPNPWSSYNEWVCADAADVQLHDDLVTYEGEKKNMPYFIVKLPGHEIDFSLSGDVQYDFVDLKQRWEELLHGTQYICFYAAYFPAVEYVGEPGSSWILSGLKTERGYWWESEEVSPTEDDDFSDDTDTLENPHLYNTSN